MKPSYLALVLLFFFAGLAALAVLPLAYGMLAIIGLVTGFIIIDALRHGILFTMAKRNFIRRKGTTALVVAGLMIGTAIVSVSFVVGDTLDNMISNQVTEGAGNVDFVVGVKDPEGGYTFLNSSEYMDLSAKIGAIDHVTAAIPSVHTYLGAMSVETGLSSPSLSITGTNTTAWSGLGGWTSSTGQKVSDGPTASGCYIYESTAKTLGVTEGGHLLLALGNQTMVLTVEHLVKNHEVGQGNLTTNVFVDMDTLDAFIHTNGSYNIMFIAVQDKPGDKYAYNAEVRDQIVTVLHSYGPAIEFKTIFDVKAQLDDGKKNAQMFTQLFFVFGSFSIIAGVALVINIFTMLGEERKSEMGMARALGMKRADLRRLFTYEGMLYALVSSLVGTLIGLGMAYIMVFAVSDLINFGSVKLADSFTFTPFSLAAAFIIGFLITITTVYLATSRISNLNIVRAVKNVPEPPVPRKDRRAFMMGVLMLLGGLCLMFIGISFESIGPAMGGLSLMTLSLGLLLRKYIGDRIAWNIAGWLTLLLWMPLPWKIFDYGMGIEMFVVSGLFMVTSALIIVIFNSDSIVMFITKVFRVKNGYRAVIKTSVSYPLRAKFRTGLSIFIFGLVIFTVTVLSMISGIINVGIQNAITDSSGGFDLIAYKTTGTFPADPWDMMNDSAAYGLTGYVEGTNITKMVELGAMPVTVGGTTLASNGTVSHWAKGTTIMGFGSDFFTVGKFPLSQWNHTTYATENDVYLAAMSDPSLVILDGSWQQTAFMEFGPGGGSSVSVAVGDTITVKSIAGPYENVTVIGIMKQTFFNGVFMQKEHAASFYGAAGTTVMMIDFKPGLDVQDQATLLEREFIPYGVQTVNVNAIAKQVTKIIDSVFTLFQAFLSLGLVIGITGLGIITIRSIHERRLEIGMMRAIGYKKRMVVANFAIESAFIAALGIILGTILGVIVGYDLYQTAFANSSFDFQFVINWVPITLISLGAFLATLACVYPAARGASKVSPAEVLRFE
ncbi:MAG: macrolide transporter ATP-binding /permease protein [Methanomassiliicoccales archaeon PtaU1.Bin124]|nr:MAG: macrolide transporter ATP-binding /permease protein [Methanomassiliicoccales archaeon PtaU1.Bin124]